MSDNLAPGTSNSQTPNPKQIPNLKSQISNEGLVWCLGFGAWFLFVIWEL
jgi:hypothetical protein